MDVQQLIMLCVYLLAGLLGLCVGSFLNVVIYRLPRGMSLSRPRSHCTTCDYQLRWYDNIPVLSYLILGGKCRGCGQAISPRYMLVELANTVLWLLSVLMFWQTSIPLAVTAAVACSVLIVIFFIDLEHLIIHNRFVLLLAAGGVVALFFDPGTVWSDHVIGAIIGGGSFALLYFGALLFIKREGLGFGDVKYSAAAGLLLGWQKWLLAILIGSVAAAVILMVIKNRRRDDRYTEYPFGPFLALGTAIALFFGNPIISWYAAMLLG